MNTDDPTTTSMISWRPLVMTTGSAAAVIGPSGVIQVKAAQELLIGLPFPAMADPLQSGYRF